WSIAQLAEGTPKVQQLVGSLGGVDAVLAAMSDHSGALPPPLAHSCAQAPQPPPLHQSVKMGIAVLPSSGCLRAAPLGPGQTRIVFGEPAVQQNAVWALASLTDDPHNQMLITGKDGLELVVCALQKHWMVPSVQHYGNYVLAKLAHESPGCSLSAASEGGLAAILKGMSAHSGVARVQEAACAALASLSSAGADIQKLIATNARTIPAIVNALTKHSKQEGVQAAGCNALASLAGRNPRFQRDAGLAGAVSTVEMALQLHPGSSAVQAAGCAAFEVLAANDQNRQLAIQIGTTQSVVAAMRKHPEERVQQRGCNALASLAPDVYESRILLLGVNGYDDTGKITEGFQAKVPIDVTEDCGSVSDFTLTKSPKALHPRSPEARAKRMMLYDRIGAQS
ncbi:hypothetical protein CYMTET_36893, partial [Cymbomonas tetramitiformis]